MITYRELTIDEISKREGFTDSFKPDEGVPLSKWFARIVNIKLKDLSDGDIAKLIRQNFHLSYVLHEALIRLYKKPLAGDLYDAEILICTSEVEDKFWEENVKLAHEVRTLLVKIKEDGQMENIKIILDEEPECILEIIERFEKKLTMILQGG